MIDDRSAAGKRNFRRDQTSAPAVLLDRERAVRELTRFLELTVRDMQLAIEYEMTSSDGAAPDSGEVVVEFRGADQELLLEENAELLLALEHIAHRWLRLDPRLHDRVRFDCGGYRASHLRRIETFGAWPAQRVRETGQELPLQSHDGSRAPG